jgi:hypothetical protein
MTKIKILIITICLYSYSFSQTCCTAGTPLLGSLEISTGNEKVVQLGLSYEHNVIETLFNESNILDDDSRERLTQTFLLEFNYGFTKKISLTGLLSFVNQTRVITSGNRDDKINAYGFGDAVLLLKYNLINLNLFNQKELSIGSGIKFPIGKYDIENNGILLPADLQPGTGSWDFLFWGYFSQGFGIGNPVNLFTNISYKLNGFNKRFSNSELGYKFGNELITSLGFGLRTDYFFDLTLFLRYRNTSADEFDEDKIANTGGNWVYLIPGLNLKTIDNFTLRLNSQIPVYRKLDGTQLTTTYTLSASIFYSFNVHEL